MMRASLAVLALSSLFWGAAQEKRKLKPAEVVVLEMSAHRSEGMVNVDGRIKNGGDQPVKGLQLILHFLGPGDVPLTTLRGPIESSVLEPGEDSDFRLEAQAPPRAIRIRLDAMDKSERDIKVDKTGPFAIE